MSAKDLDVYQSAYRLAMRVFELSRSFPGEEKFALTSQIRRSSRSICLNLREAWAKRRYEAHFISKLTDCDGESKALERRRWIPARWDPQGECAVQMNQNSETDSSLDFARDCGYITDAQHQETTDICRQVGRMLGRMLIHPDGFLTSDL